MTRPLRHYGWECSPYSSKTRAYLRYKGIPHEDIHPSAIVMKRVMEARVGFMIMPIVILPDDTVLQDSSDIIDQLEAAHPDRGIVPESPVQGLAALLFELLGDEWLPIIAMHTRWDLAENRAFITSEFGRCAFPWLPVFISRRLARPVAAKMASYLPILGVEDATRPAIDAWTDELLDGLDAHFAHHPYLLGGRPCIGDFSMYGPLYAHVWRDPASRARVESRANVLQWIERMRDPAGEPGAFLADDALSEELLPILSRIFRELFPVLRATAESLERWVAANPDSPRLPRGLDSSAFQLGAATGTRRLMTYQQWMLQRPLDFYNGLEPTDRATVDGLLERVGGTESMQLQLAHRVTRKRFRVVLEG